MTMQENLDQLKKLIQHRFGKQIQFYNLPKDRPTSEVLNDEMAMSLLQNKSMRHYYKAEKLIIPIFRGVILDGAVIVLDAEDLELNQRLQLTELVELLVTDILSLEDDSFLLSQTADHLERQLSNQKAYYSESLLSNIIH